MLCPINIGLITFSITSFLIMPWTDVAKCLSISAVSMAVSMLFSV